MSGKTPKTVDEKNLDSFCREVITMANLRGFGAVVVAASAKPSPMLGTAYAHQCNGDIPSCRLLLKVAALDFREKAATIVSADIEEKSVLQ